MMGSDSIMWTIKFRNGGVKRFKFPIRTVAAGSIDIFSDAAKADIARIKQPGFYSHHARGDALPVPAPLAT
jgi:adenylylsulfate reductase subunit B